VLDHLAVLDAQAALLRGERARLATELAAIPGVKPLPSAANFILARVPNADAWMAGLKSRGVLVKNLSAAHTLTYNCLRLSVGTPEENTAMLAALKELAS
jgi:histidinol-phosphate aminotransferase